MMLLQATRLAESSISLPRACGGPEAWKRRANDQHLLGGTHALVDLSLSLTLEVRWVWHDLPEPRYRTVLLTRGL